MFWVAACAGIIVFGSLMGAMFIGQQFLQNVLGYSTLEAGAAILPAAVCMVIVAPRSAKLVDAHGARFTLLVGYVFCLLGFLTMLLLWKDGISYWKVGLGYMLVGIGVGFAGTPASHSLTGSVPVDAGGHGVGDRRPPARPRRRHHAVDPRGVAHRGLRVGDHQGDRGHRRTRRRSPNSVQNAAHEVVLERRGDRAAVSAVREPDHRGREVVVHLRARTGPTSPGSSRSCSARHSCSSCSRSGTASSSCSREYQQEDDAVYAAEHPGGSSAMTDPAERRPIRPTESRGRRSRGTTSPRHAAVWRTGSARPTATASCCS